MNKADGQILHDELQNHEILAIIAEMTQMQMLHLTVSVSIISKLLVNHFIICNVHSFSLLSRSKPKLTSNPNIANS